MITRFVSVASNNLGHVAVHQVRRLKNECAWARRTATSHPPVQQRHGRSSPDGLSLHTPYSRRSASKLVTGHFVQALNTINHSRFLVHCETEENPLSHLSFRREVIILSQDGSTTTNCKGAGWWRKICHSIVCQMEFGETVTVTKRSH